LNDTSASHSSVTGNGVPICTVSRVRRSAAEAVVGLHVPDRRGRIVALARGRREPENGFERSPGK
jgi:hypothetical protein